MEKVAGSANLVKRNDRHTGQVYTLKNKKGLEAKITYYGARLFSLLIPDSRGNAIDVIGGSDKPNALHDGNNSSWATVWNAEEIEDNGVRLGYFSKNSEGAFPGNLKVKRTYFLNEDNSLKIVYEAVTDKTTVIDLSNNPFFNLNGAACGTILNHQVSIKADNYIPICTNMSPTDGVEPVAGTPFDFRNSATIGSRINDHNEQLKIGHGYDHHFVLNPHASRTPVAKIKGDKSGIIMEIFTDQPRLHFYSGNFIKGKAQKKDGGPDQFHTSFAMKIVHYSDLPASPGFPLTLLRPGEVYRSVSCFQFKN